MRVKFGLLGCGRQAPKHISGLLARGNVEIAVADIHPERAERLAATLPVTALASPEDIFADPDIAAVSICTPPATHGELISRAIATGRHFICEKPLTASLAEARSLEAATRASGLVGMVGYIYRFAPAFELAATALAGAADMGEAAALGHITSAFFRIGGQGSHDAWQHRRETAGGAINEMLVHMIDLALWYFGPIAEARLLAADMREQHRHINGEIVEPDVEDWILTRMKTASGVDVVVQADLTTPTFMQFAEIHGHNGSFMGSIQPDMPTFLHLLEEQAGFPPGRTPYDFGPRNLFEAQMGLFLDCVVEGRKLDKCTLADSVRLMEAIELLRDDAARRGIPAPWTAGTEGREPALEIP